MIETWRLFRAFIEAEGTFVLELLGELHDSDVGSSCLGFKSATNEMELLKLA